MNILSLSYILLASLASSTLTNECGSTYQVANETPELQKRTVTQTPDYKELLTHNLLKGDRLKYRVTRLVHDGSPKKRTVTGDLYVEVVDVSRKSIKLNWDEVSFGQGWAIWPSGTFEISRSGELLDGDMSEVSAVYLIQMVLPEVPVDFYTEFNCIVGLKPQRLKNIKAQGKVYAHHGNVKYGTVYMLAIYGRLTREDDQWDYEIHSEYSSELGTIIKSEYSDITHGMKFTLDLLSIEHK